MNDISKNPGSLQNTPMPSGGFSIAPLLNALRAAFLARGDNSVIVEFVDDDGESFSAEIREVDVSKLDTAIVLRCKTPG